MSRDVAFFIAGYGDGGVEKMLVRLAVGLARRKSLRVDFLAPAGERPYLELLRDAVRVVPLQKSRLTSQLQAYLSEAQPARLITGKPDDEALAVRALASLDVGTRLFCRIGIPQLHRLRQRTRNPLRRWHRRHALQATYRHVDGFLAVSRATAEELTGELGVPAQRVHVLPNPVIDDDVLRAGRTPCPHPWLNDGGAPVILGAGGLRRQKDFSTLIRAFARLRMRRAARLLIIGEGRQRKRLKRLVNHLGMDTHVDLPGFTPNPYCYLHRAAIFALCSRWEGQPNVLIEAMAMGTPVVATDCVSGPRDILGDGRFGELCPVGDDAALADAIERTLDAPPSPRLLSDAVGSYSMAASIDAYAAALGLGLGPDR